MLSGDPLCKALVAELRELSQRMCDEREYQKRGHACFLAGMRSQAQHEVTGACSLAKSNLDATMDNHVS